MHCSRKLQIVHWIITRNEVVNRSSPSLQINLLSFPPPPLSWCGSNLIFSAAKTTTMWFNFNDSHNSQCYLSKCDVNLSSHPCAHAWIDSMTNVPCYRFGLRLRPCFVTLSFAISLFPLRPPDDDGGMNGAFKCVLQPCFCPLWMRLTTFPFATNAQNTARRCSHPILFFSSFNSATS